MMSGKCSAVAGAFVAQAVYMYLAMEMPTYQAAWAWDMKVPTGMGFTCTEGTTVECSSTKKTCACTVTPATGFTCDVSSTKIVCSDSKAATKFTDAVPTAVKCLNIGHKPGKSDNDDTSTLAWKPVPSCKKGTSTTASETGATTANSLAFGALAVASMALAASVP